MVPNMGNCYLIFMMSVQQADSSIAYVIIACKTECRR